MVYNWAYLQFFFSVLKCFKRKLKFKLAFDYDNFSLLFTFFKMLVWCAIESKLKVFFYRDSIIHLKTLKQSVFFTIKFLSQNLIYASYFQKEIFYLFLFALLILLNPNFCEEIASLSSMTCIIFHHSIYFSTCFLINILLLQNGCLNKAYKLYKMSQKIEILFS